MKGQGVIDITAQEAILRLRAQAHAQAANADPLLDAALIAALEAGTMRAGLDEDGNLCFMRVAD